MDSLSAVLFFFFFIPNLLWGMKPSLDTLFIVQMTNQKQGQQGQLGQHFSLSRPRTCADESIESAVLAVPSYHHDVMSFSLDSLDICRRQGCFFYILSVSICILRKNSRFFSLSVILFGQIKKKLYLCAQIRIF